MRLGLFLAEGGLSDASFALAVREYCATPVTRQAVGRWKREPGDRRQQIPGPAFMRAIFLASSGQVTPNDFYDLPKLPQEAQAMEQAA